MDTSVVDIWRIRLSGVTDLDDCVSVLSTAELERAERFRFDKDRLRYVASHVAIRRILAKYVGCDAGSLSFRQGVNGKPELEGSTLHHNLAHSSDLALLAVSAGEAVGIDIEKRRVVPEVLAIAARMFTETERRMIVEAPERSDMFLRCWTAKEAILKATGEGLNGAPQSFDVTSALLGEDALVHSPSGSDSFWVVRGLELGPDYFGAIARRRALSTLDISAWDTFR